MTVAAEKAAATVTYQGQTFHFCSAMCKTKFSMDPAKYVGAHPSHGHHGEDDSGHKQE